MPFDLDRITRETAVLSVEFHDEIASTNTRALEAAASAQRFPFVVLTDRQTAGRGRGSNLWWAGDGSLAFSLVVDGKSAGWPMEWWPRVALTAGLAVTDVIADLLPAADVRLKWPNDVFLNGRKVCGILVEVAPRPAGAMVIGIGINVNHRAEHAPPELRELSTTLIDEARRPFDLSDLLCAILQRWFVRGASLSGTEWPLAEAWRERCLLHGRTIQFDVGTQSTIGVCQSIDDQGALLLQTEVGTARFVAGTVRRIL